MHWYNQLRLKAHLFAAEAAAPAAVGAALLAKLLPVTAGAPDDVLYGLDAIDLLLAATPRADSPPLVLLPDVLAEASSRDILPMRDDKLPLVLLA